MNITATPARALPAPTPTPTMVGLPAFPTAPAGWRLAYSNPKNDLVLGYMGPVLLSPDGSTFIGIDQRWTLLDELRRAALSVGSRGGHGPWRMATR